MDDTLFQKYCIVSYRNVLYCIVFYCIVLYYIILYCKVLYCVAHALAEMKSENEKLQCPFIYVSVKLFHFHTRKFILNKIFKYVGD